MKFLFIDESKRNKKKIKRALILSGLMIDADKVVSLENSLDKLKERYNLKHLKDNKKQKNKEFTKDLKKLLLSYNVKIISLIYGEYALSGFKKIEDAYIYSFGFLLERFFINLNQKKDTGIIIHDTISNKKYLDEAYRIIKEKKFKSNWTTKETPYKRVIYPLIFTANDNCSNIIQTIDLISRSISSAYSKLREDILNQKSDLIEIKERIPDLRQYNDYLNIYWELFIKNPNNNTPSNYGIKIWL